MTDRKTASSDLSELWEGYRAAGSKHGDDCPSSDDLGRLVDGRAGRHAPALADHVIVCDPCRFEVEAATAWRRAQLEAGSGASPRSRRATRAAVAAAVAVLALGGAWLVAGRFLPSAPYDDVTRSVESTDILFPERNASVAEAPDRFEWQPQSGAESYRVEVYSATSELLWRGPEVEQSRVPLPDDVVLGIGPLAWEVHVSGPVAEPVLGPFWFVVESAETPTDGG